MTPLRSLLAAALGLAALSASPAAAQGWRDDGWRDRGARSQNWGGYERPHYGYNGNDVEAGVTDIAICPGGYHLGRSGRLCWPD